MTRKTSSTNTPRLYPNAAEEAFMKQAYLAFYDARDRYYADLSLTPEQRFALITKILSLYSECLLYKPIRMYVEHIEQTRPPGEGTAYRYLEIIRHLLVHFSFFDSWDQVMFNREIITWQNKHSKIDTFLAEFDGHEPYKWRVWDAEGKTMEYGYKLNFPQDYRKGGDIFLRDLIEQDKGIDFSILLIELTLKSQLA